MPEASQNSAPTTHRWWNIKRAAEHLEIHPVTMLRRARKAVKKYSLKRTGMPVVRFGNKGPYKFPIEAFKAWAENPTE